MALSGYNVCLLTDIALQGCQGNNIQVITTALGNRLGDWQPNARFLRITRHLLQLLVFNCLGTIKAVSMARQGWVIVNHNLEVCCGDIFVLHNVFNAEHAKDGRSMAKLLRLLNPIFTFRIVREKMLMSLADGKMICAVSEATAKEASHYMGKNNKLTYINNGVDVDKFKPTKLHAKTKECESTHKKEEFVILFVGHEFERKGLGYIIESLSLMPCHVKLQVLGGRGSIVSNYQWMASKLNVTTRVSFMGTQKKTLEFYQNADIFILPSAYEAWPLVGLEAMSCGLPVLITPVGGVVEFLEDRINGFFIERSAKSIADKVNILINNHSLRMSMGKAARKTALKYSWDQIADQYINLIAEVAENKKNA